MDIYKRHLYHNDDYDTLVNDTIIEYDIQSAGFNLIKQFKLLPDKDIEFMESLGKKNRQIFIGTQQRKNKDLSRQLNEAFVEARRWFFEKNALEQDDILSIKKDAIFVRRKCTVLETGFVKFAEKNVYSSFIRIGKIELYYNPRTLDVKGIGIDNIHLHEKYMISFIKSFFYLLENGKKKKQIQFIRDFAYYYKRREIATGYYREFNPSSGYRLNEQLLGRSTIIDHMDEVDELNISYNYMNIIVPLSNILI